MVAGLTYEVVTGADSTMVVAGAMLDLLTGLTTSVVVVTGAYST